MSRREEEAVRVEEGGGEGSSEVEDRGGEGEEGRREVRDGRVGEGT